MLFSGPIPEFSCKLNAWATALTCQWLMGPCAVNDIELEDGKVGDQGGVGRRGGGGVGVGRTAEGHGVGRWGAGVCGGGGEGERAPMSLLALAHARA